MDNDDLTSRFDWMMHSLTEMLRSALEQDANEQSETPYEDAANTLHGLGVRNIESWIGPPPEAPPRG
jgi:hypothetical protein